MDNQPGVRTSRIGRRAISAAVGVVIALACTSVFEADAGPQAAPIGCHGLSPASAQACTAEQLRAALDR